MKLHQAVLPRGKSSPDSLWDCPKESTARKQEHSSAPDQLQQLRTAGLFRGLLLHLVSLAQSCISTSAALVIKEMQSQENGVSRVRTLYVKKKKKEELLLRNDSKGQKTVNYN